MSTGGTIPTEITQKVSFYCTTGVIERDKNIYYCPRLRNAVGSLNNPVNINWLNLFNSAVSSYDEYKEIVISNWSPEDRTLIIKGNIDDFRTETEEGYSLNYFILERTVVKGSSSETHYYAFFITNAQQAGIGSVRLSYEPDDFTNVFYLHNKTRLSPFGAEYEPFNGVLKNCYVERQHYNRIKQEKTSEAKHIYMELQYNDSTQTYAGRALFKPNLVNVTADVSLFEEDLSYESHYDYLTGMVTITITPKEQQILRIIYRDVTFRGVKVKTEPDNLEIFLNTEEAFKYRYQYRDEKSPITFNGTSNFTKEELQSIEEAQNWGELSSQLKKKVALNCVGALKVVTTKDIMVHQYNESYERGDSRKRGMISQYSHTDMGLQIIKFPTITGNKLFEKFSPYTNIRIEGADSANSFISSMQQDGYGQYILSATIEKDSDIFKNATTSIDYNGKLIINLNPLPTPSSYEATDIFSSGLYAVNVARHKEDFGKSTEDVEAGNRLIGLISSGNATSFNNLEITFNEKMLNPKENYIDFVIESEPYSFYTISYIGGLEITLLKQRYYQSLIDNKYTVKLAYINSDNEANKIGLIPIYNVNGEETYYYTEGLIFTSSSSIPVISDQLAVYYNENKSRMKAQYAVNAIQGAGNIVTGGARGLALGSYTVGGAGAIAGAIGLVQSEWTTHINQQATLADVGRMPDTIKQAGSDIVYDIRTGEFGFSLNHYTIDEVSYKSIAKYLERFGYKVNIYSSLNTMDRVGWNYIKLIDFDYEANITSSQETSIRKIFTEGVTLLHDKSYMTQGHNYEKLLDE